MNVIGGSRYQGATGKESVPEHCLFGTHLRPMGLNVLGYQSHLGIVAVLPVPRRILLKVIAYVPYFNEKVRCQPSNGGLYGVLVKCKGMETREGKSTLLFVEAMQMSKRRETHELVWVKRCVWRRASPLEIRLLF